MNRTQKAVADVIRRELLKPPSPQEKLLLDLLSNSNELLVRLQRIENKLEQTGRPPAEAPATNDTRVASLA